jgi:demethylmenaquinone methyltransferase / 2-methoxy-6-polyprenyl-1,4-benzoquinol methylase
VGDGGSHPEGRTSSRRLTDTFAAMADWRSYDTIAEAYERIWAPRFETVARHLLAVAPPVEGSRLLDLGTGMGAVASALGDKARTLRAIVGCDLSLAMLSKARHRVPQLRLVVGDVTRLPFRDASFDLATANCVLSHLADYHRALAEIVRVLARPGALATASWGPSSDPYATAWKQLLEGAVGADTAQSTAAIVVPSESHFAFPENVRATLVDAGFTTARAVSAELAHDCSVDEYLADRELSAGGRFGHHALGDPGWRRFLGTARDEFVRRFGDRVRYSRSLVLGVGTLG